MVDFYVFYVGVSLPFFVEYVLYPHSLNSFHNSPTPPSLAPLIFGSTFAASPSLTYDNFFPSLTFSSSLPQPCRHLGFYHRVCRWVSTSIKFLFLFLVANLSLG